ncbi:MAG: hypothetical protein RLZZ84_471 [Pseudomonadota bacterium]|jgi:cytochrome c556
MKTARIIAAAALLASAWAVSAKPVPAPASSAAPSPAQLVMLRQSGMDMSATTLNLIKGGSANGMPLKSLGFAANGLAKWAQAMPALFADGTRPVPSRARAEVWTNKADFAAKSAAFSAATKALAAAIAAEDQTAFASALASTGAACKGCHDTYQAPPAAKPAG